MRIQWKYIPVLTGLALASGAAAAQSQAPCAPGWIASATTEQGTVATGGIMRGKSQVCGAASAAAALKSVIELCDAQTAGGCRRANRIKLDWGYWDGQKPSPGEVDPKRPYETAIRTGGESCDSALPLVVSASCKAQAAAQVRAAGMP